MKQDATHTTAKPTKESGSINLWKWKSPFWMMIDLATFGGQRTTLSWDMKTGSVEVRDSNNLVILTTRALEINRYHFSTDGSYTIWIQGTPHYFAIASKSSSKIVDIIDTAFLENISRSVADIKSPIGALKDFLEESNPNVVGFSSYRSNKDRRNVVIAAFVIIAIVVLAGIVARTLGGN